MPIHATVDDQKRAAAERALEFVKPGMKLGLGTGSTAEHFVRVLAAKKLNVTCTATSERTEALARELGLALKPLDEIGALDLTVDGADEIGPELALIKGGGGALLREKIVAAASARMVVIADSAKRVNMLGRFPLPVEIVPFAARTTMAKIAAASAAAGCGGNLVTLRGGAKPYVTDGGHWIADCDCKSIPDPHALAHALAAIPGVVEHGLFLDLASAALLGTPNSVEIVENVQQRRGARA